MPVLKNQEQTEKTQIKDIYDRLCAQIASNDLTDLNELSEHLLNHFRKNNIDLHSKAADAAIIKAAVILNSLSKSAVSDFSLTCTYLLDYGRNSKKLDPLARLKDLYHLSQTTGENFKYLIKIMNGNHEKLIPEFIREPEKTTERLAALNHILGENAREVFFYFVPCIEFGGENKPLKNHLLESFLKEPDRTLEALVKLKGEWKGDFGSVLSLLRDTGFGFDFATNPKRGADILLKLNKETGITDAHSIMRNSAFLNALWRSPAKTIETLKLIQQTAPEITESIIRAFGSEIWPFMQKDMPKEKLERQLSKWAPIVSYLKKEFDIEYFERYNAEILENAYRTATDAEFSKGKKIALIGLNKADSSRAFTQDTDIYLSLIKNGYCIVFFETRNDEDFAERYFNYGKRDGNPSTLSGRKYDLVIIGGHGNVQETQLGFSSGEQSTLDTRDLNKSKNFKAGSWDKMLNPRALFILESCLTGAFAGERKINNADFFKLLAPSAKVLAPTDSTSVKQLYFDLNGKAYYIEYYKGNVYSP